MLLHASLPTGLLTQSMLLYLSWEAKKVRIIFFLFWGDRGGGKRTEDLFTLHNVL